MPALDGMKILDMTQYEAGPSCTQVLAWFGADVVKIESPGRGDGARGFGRDGRSGYSAFFCAWNANKRSLAVDLGRRRGRELLLRLVPAFDVFVENYGPGVIERFDIGYETLGALNPGLVYARIKGFGASGPRAGYDGVDPTAQAAAGVSDTPLVRDLAPARRSRPGGHPGPVRTHRRDHHADLRGADARQAARCDPGGCVP